MPVKTSAILKIFKAIKLASATGAV